MARVAKMHGKWYVETVKGWVNDQGDISVVHAEAHVKFYKDESLAALDGFKGAGKAPEVKK